MGHKEKHCCIQDAGHAWNEKEEASTTQRNQKTVGRKNKWLEKHPTLLVGAVLYDPWNARAVVAAIFEWRGGGLKTVQQTLNTNSVSVRFIRTLAHWQVEERYDMEWEMGES